MWSSNTLRAFPTQHTIDCCPCQKARDLLGDDPAPVCTSLWVRIQDGQGERGCKPLLAWGKKDTPLSSTFIIDRRAFFTVALVYPKKSEKIRKLVVQTPMTWTQVVIGTTKQTMPLGG